MSFQPTDTSWRPGRASGPRAGFVPRLFAELIDIVVWVILGSIVGSVIHIPREITIFLVSTLYFAFLEGGRHGQSIGKRLMQIRVVSIDDGTPIGYQRGLIRSLGRILSAIPLYLGFLWMLWDPERQTWHDKLSRSVVIPATPQNWQ